MEKDPKLEWISISDAAKHFSVTCGTISKIVQKKKLETKKDSWDDRLVLVRLVDIQIIFNNKYKKIQEHQIQK